MKTIPRSEVTNRAMINGNEGKLDTIILDGVVKEWVGFGWIDVRKATKVDKENFPTVQSTD